MLRRRQAFVAAAALATAPCAAQSVRPVRAIVPFPPGGGVDAFARAFAPALSALLGQPVVIENIGGAASRLGTSTAIRAPADGQTILITNDTLVAIEAVPPPGASPLLPGLAPVLLGASAPQMLVTHPRSGLPDAAAYAARLRSGRAPTVGVPGLNSSQHFASELLADALGGRPEHVAYRGGGPLIVDLLGGQLDAGVVTLGAAIEHVRDGRLVGLGVTSLQRSPALPALASFAETVAPGFAAETWVGVLVPAATAPATVAALHAASEAALRDPGVTARLASLGFETPGLGPDAFGARLRESASRFLAIARSVGLRAEDA